jgi:glycosyltransferase involved in cell wall biosynthesis
VRVLLTIHHLLDRNSGAPGTTMALAEAYQRAGHETEILSYDDLPARFGAQARMLAFPALVASRLAGSLGRWCDAVDAATGDTWLTRRPRGGPVLATRSHGLEHRLHLEFLRDHLEGRTPLRKRYFLYHGREQLREVAVSLRRSDLAFFLNDDDLDFAVAELGIQRERAHVVWNGIDSSLLGLPRPGAAEIDAPLRLALIARHTEGMGAGYYVPALERVLQRHRSVRVTLLGSALPAETVLRDFAAPVRSRVSVVPTYERSELPGLLEGHEILVSAKYAEGFGKGLVEGMACGLAPVAAAASGPKTIIENGKTGLLVPPRDNDALVEAVERLIESPDLRTKLRRNAHAAAQRYSWDGTAAERLALFDAARASNLRPVKQPVRDAWTGPSDGVAETPANTGVEPDVGHKKVA